MSFGVVAKLLRCLGVSAAVWLAMPGVGWGQVRAVFGGGVTSCGSCCQSHHCPPAFKHCQEGPPRLHYQHGCPHPVGNPCELPHWGYFEACWTPYPWPTDWSHCPMPPPAAFVGLNANYNPYGVLPVPRAPVVAPPTAPSAVPPATRDPDLPEQLPAPRIRPPGLQ